MLSRHLWLQRPVALQPMAGELYKKKKKKKNLEANFKMRNLIFASIDLGKFLDLSISNLALARLDWCWTLNIMI